MVTCQIAALLWLTLASAATQRPGGTDPAGPCLRLPGEATARRAWGGGVLVLPVFEYGDDGADVAAGVVGDLFGDDVGGFAGVVAAVGEADTVKRPSELTHGFQFDA